MPYGPVLLRERSSILSFEELLRVIRGFSRIGVKKVRFTGGEPLLRSNFSTLLMETSKIDGVESIGITTNGYYLNEFIDDFLSIKKPLSINISLDTLNRKRFEDITGLNAFERIMKNLEEGLRKGLNIKINTVVLKGINEDEIPHIIEWGIEAGVSEVRFIELMSFRPRGKMGNFSETLKVCEQEILKIIKEKFILFPLGRYGKAVKFLVNKNKPVIGIISSDSDEGCLNCSKLRITPEGKLLFCLKSSLYADLKGIIATSDDENLVEKLREIVVYKKYVRREKEIPSYGMHLIGG